MGGRGGKGSRASHRGSANRLLIGYPLPASLAQSCSLSCPPPTAREWEGHEGPKGSPSGHCHKLQGAQSNGPALTQRLWWAPGSLVLKIPQVVLRRGTSASTKDMPSTRGNHLASGVLRHEPQFLLPTWASVGPRERRLTSLGLLTCDSSGLPAPCAPRTMVRTGRRWQVKASACARMWHRQALPLCLALLQYYYNLLAYHTSLRAPELVSEASYTLMPGTKCWRKSFTAKTTI